ncbi:M1-specific T cell receptor beta chain-like [Acipenser ruthenus]|uniref:M1-specific T cell receptor beta chain-like n=1 Tax=Acipenser ruthenus TaxID=7906 RepID=UPI0027423F17|nr:M1-specific T cell receptor beta chain-like [Acipenser ruthenus]
MATLFCSLTVLLSITSFSQAVTVTQTPEILLSSKRTNVTINCKHDQSTHYQIYWYRQVRDGGLTLIGYSTGANHKEIEKGFESKFGIIRPDTYHSSLEITSLTSEDTAVYFCCHYSTKAIKVCLGSQPKAHLCLVGKAVLLQLSNSVNNNPAHFGNGTKLTVLEHDISEPILHILEPSKEEIVQKKRVTLVCLATNFYPDHINITWKINGKNRDDGVKTDDYAIKDNNANNYSISSRLRLTPSEWFNPQNIFTCAVKFYKGDGSETVTPEKHISGKDGCGMTKALNRNESVAAQISYMLLVGKSLMYGLFVTFLAWKLRPNSSSKRLN